MEEKEVERSKRLNQFHTATAINTGASVSIFNLLAEFERPGCAAMKILFQISMAPFSIWMTLSKILNTF